MANVAQIGAVSATAQAGREFTIGGKTYRFQPLRTREWGEFLEWVRQRTLNRAIEQTRLILVPIADPRIPGSIEERRAAVELRQLIIDRAHAAAWQVRLTNDSALPMVVAPDAMAYVCWLSLKRNHPDISLAQATDLFEEADDATVIWQVVMDLSGIEISAPSDEGAVGAPDVGKAVESSTSTRLSPASSGPRGRADSRPIRSPI